MISDYSKYLDKAVNLAAQFHAGQVDLNNQPYILHVTRVAMAGKNPEQIITGYLHDIVEDTKIELEDLYAENFPLEIVIAVDLLTHDTKLRTYWEYLENMKNNALALEVKLNDINDNLLPERQKFLGAEGHRVRHEKAKLLVEDYRHFLYNGIAPHVHA